MTTTSDQSAALASCVERLTADGSAPGVIAAFKDRFSRFAGGDTGLVAESTISPVGEVAEFADTVDDDAARVALAETAMVRLNGGLGTSMGLAGPKCLIPVRNGQSFLDIVVRQVLAARRATGARLPLILMNSYNTSAATLAALEAHRDLPVENIPSEFLQSRQPKISAADSMPVNWPTHPDLEWCPPGHGDFYPSIFASGLVDLLLEAGFRRLFVSNIDNLGALPEARLAGWFATSGAPFAMEVARRTMMDRKGGHLARRLSDGRLILRESAQTADEEMPAFMDITRHQWMNTNSMWIDLPALRRVLADNNGIVPLPLIVNRKTVDPADPSSPEVIQLEGAMGAAIEVFDGATAISVPRSRFLPVKSTADLALLRSDVYEFTDSAELIARTAAPTVTLDSRYFKLIADFERRFPEGVPSLVGASSFTVEGDWTFEAGVIASGEARLADLGSPGVVPANATITEGGLG